MNRSDYKRLGNYIREVDVRNRDLVVTNLLGVSISKEFIPSIANTIGTDMSSYKVVRPNQFAYGPVTSRNGDKVSIALFHGDECAIISQAYTVFEVQDGENLMPEYLMMWFRRPEFDRYARFHSHGSAREIFDWDEMCDVLLPVPSIERQRAMVAECETLSRRIDLNRSMIAQLEATAQTLYRKMFVDDIDPEHLPAGWRMGTIGEFCDIFTGRKDVSEASIDGLYTFFSCSPTTFKSNDFIYDGEAVLIAGNGSYTGRVSYFNGRFDLYQRTYACTLLQNVDKSYMLYLYCCLKFGFEKKYMGGSRGSSIPYIVRGDISEYPVVISDYQIKKFYLYIKIVVENIIRCEHITRTMNELQSLLLAKMGQ